MALIQAITIEDHRYEQALRNGRFHQALHLPGQLHSVDIGDARRAAAARTDLKLFHLEDIGPSYALTLRHWRERFMHDLAQVRALGYPERFIRMWNFYLCYCEGGFLERSIGDVQLLLVKPGARPPQFLPDLNGMSLARQCADVPGLLVGIRRRRRARALVDRLRRCCCPSPVATAYQPRRRVPMSCWWAWRRCSASRSTRPSCKRRTDALQRAASLAGIRTGVDRRPVDGLRADAQPLAALPAPRPVLALVLGAAAGPLAYWVAARAWDAVDLLRPWPAMAALALAWGVLTPALVALAQRFAVREAGVAG